MNYRLKRIDAVDAYFKDKKQLCRNLPESGSGRKRILVS